MIDLAIAKTLDSAAGGMKLQLNLRLKAKSFVALYGKSGAGKTSLLRMLAGLLTPEQGHIIVQETPWFDSQAQIHLPPQARNVGFLFQDYALFPHMTVQENLKFALGPGQNPRIIQELIEIMELGALRKRKPQTLSGGQQQRVALARALVQKPTLLMLDEPLSALDAEMRAKLQRFILQVHRKFELTTILVSHDIAEISTLADEVLCLDAGQVTQRGTPAEVFAASFPDPPHPSFTQYDARQYPTLDVVTGYGEWSNNYDQTVYPQLDLPLLEELESVPWPMLQRAIDLGCGTGRIGVWLRQQGIEQIDGVDCTVAMARQALEKGTYHQIAIADMLQTGRPDQHYDLAISSLAVCHVADLQGFYEEVGRLLRPGGFLVLVDYHPFFLLRGIPTHFERDDGTSIAIQNFIHLLSDQVTAGREQGWTLLEMRERVIDSVWASRQVSLARHLHQPISFGLVWQQSAEQLSPA